MGKGLFRDARRAKQQRQRLHLMNQVVDEDTRKDIERVVDRSKDVRKRSN